MSPFFSFSAEGGSGAGPELALETTSVSRTDRWCINRLLATHVAPVNGPTLISAHEPTLPPPGMPGMHAQAPLTLIPLCTALFLQYSRAHSLYAAFGVLVNSINHLEVWASAMINVFIGRVPPSRLCPMRPQARVLNDMRQARRPVS